MTPPRSFVPATALIMFLLAPSLAEEPTRTVNEVYRLEREQLDVSLRYPRLTSSHGEVQHRINHALRALATGTARSARDAQLWIPADRPWVHVTPTLITERLASFMTVDPSGRQRTAIFDLRDGNQVAERRLFVAGAHAAVHGLVVRALHREYAEHRLRNPEPGDLGRIAVFEDGLAFLWTRGALDPRGWAQRIAPVVFLPYQRLAGLLDQDLLGELTQVTQEQTEGLPRPRGLADPGEEAYLDALAVEAARLRVSTESRAALARDDDWRRAETVRRLVWRLYALGEDGAELGAQVLGARSRARDLARRRGFSGFNRVHLRRSEVSILARALGNAVDVVDDAAALGADSAEPREAAGMVDVLPGGR